MLAIQGNVRDWHFRHDSNSACKGGQESALHKLGKQILMESRALEIPDFGRFEYENALDEKILVGTQYRSDVLLQSNERSVHVEILVTHKNKIEKEEYYKSQRIESLEIDLSGFFENFAKVSLGDIKKVVLEEIDKKQVIFWEKPVGVIPENKEVQKVEKVKEIEGRDNSWIGWIVGFVIALIAFVCWKDSTTLKRGFAQKWQKRR